MKDNTLTFDSVSSEQINTAVNETVNKTRPHLLDFIRKRIPDADDAEDILQDVFYQLLQAYRIEPVEQISAWLYKVTRNKITDRFRKKKTESLDKDWHLANEEEERLGLLDFIPNDSTSVETAMLREAIMNELEIALAELPAEQREVFLLHEMDGKSFNEISELKKVGVNTLISRKRYAVLYLRERLRDLYDELITD